MDKVVERPVSCRDFFDSHTGISVYLIRSDIGQRSDIGKNNIPFSLKVTVQEQSENSVEL